MKITIQSFGGSALYVLKFSKQDEMYKVYYELINHSSRGDSFNMSNDDVLVYIPHNVLRTSIITCFKKEE